MLQSTFETLKRFSLYYGLKAYTRIRKNHTNKRGKKIGARVKDDYFKINTNIDILYDR